MDDVERGEAAEAEASRAGAVAAPARERRMTAGRKRDAALRVLRREPLEIVAHDLSVTAADLSTWYDAFLEAGEASLKSWQRDVRDETIARLRTKVGELTMDNELLHAKVGRLESGVPFGRPRSKRRARSSRSPQAAATASPGSAVSGASHAWASTGGVGQPTCRRRRDGGRNPLARAPDFYVGA